MFEPTTDRNVRLSVGELQAIRWALRDEITKRRRSIAKAEANRAAGGRVMHNVLDEHHTVLRDALQARTIVEVALSQIDLKNTR
jgi:hypothetical protein